MRINITGSKGHRVWKCPASAVLPQVESVDASPARGKGRGIHEFLQRASKIGTDEAIELAPEELRPLLSLIDLTSLPTQLATEVAFAWDWKARKAREIGRDLDRNYGELGPTEIALTADIVGVQADFDFTRGLVGDYKSGRTRYPSPDKFGQTLLGALCVRDVYKCDEVIADLYYLTDDGDNYRARRKLDEWDLDLFADEFARSMELVDEYEALIERGGTPNVVEGSHCAYCPATKSCPAKLALVSRLPTEIEGIVRTGLPMTVERAAVSFLAIERFTEMLATLQSEIFTLAETQDIELPDGRVIGWYEHSKRSLDFKATAAVLEERYGPESVKLASKSTISLEALKSEAQRNLKGNKRLTTKAKTGEFDELIAKLEEVGGVKHQHSRYVKAHTKKR